MGDSRPSCDVVLTDVRGAAGRGARRVSLVIAVILLSHSIPLGTRGSGNLKWAGRAA